MSDYVKPDIKSLYSDGGEDVTPITMGITFVLGPVAVVAGAVAAAVAAAGAAVAYNVAAVVEAVYSETTVTNSE